MTESSKPPIKDVDNIVTRFVAHICLAIMRERLDSGERLEIPSLNLWITKEDLGRITSESSKDQSSHTP